MHQATVAFKHPTMLPAILGNPAFRPCSLLPQRATFCHAGSQQSKCSSRTRVGLDSIWLPVCLLTLRNWFLVAYFFLPARSLRPAFFRPFIRTAILPLLKSTLSTVFFLSFTFSYLPLKRFRHYYRLSFWWKLQSSAQNSTKNVCDPSNTSVCTYSEFIFPTVTKPLLLTKLTMQIQRERSI